MGKLRLVDSNILIEGHKRYYSFDICSGFWKWLDAAHADKKIASVHEVFVEISKREDVLKDWADNRPGFFLSRDSEISNECRRIAAKIRKEYKNDKSMKSFFNGADLPLVATAKVKNAILVTDEMPAEGEGDSRLVKIPDVCQKNGVVCERGIYKFMKEYGVDLKWGD